MKALIVTPAEPECLVAATILSIGLAAGKPPRPASAPTTNKPTTTTFSAVVLFLVSLPAIDDVAVTDPEAAAATKAVRA